MNMDFLTGLHLYIKLLLQININIKTSTHLILLCNRSLSSLFLVMVKFFVAAYFNNELLKSGDVRNVTLIN